MLGKKPATEVIIIEPKRSLFDFRFGELFRSRELIQNLIRRDFVTVYKQTILGPLWFIVNPLITTGMYVFVFGRIARLGTDGIPQPLFYFSGTMLWALFSSCLQKSSDTFINNAALFGKIYFPRLAVTISYISTNLRTFGIQFGVFLILFLYYSIRGVTVSPTLWALAFPILILQIVALGTGLGLILSSVTTKYRDLRNLITLGLNMWMYITPVVYPISEVPKRFELLYSLNILSPVMELSRYVLLGRGSVSLEIWAISFIVSCLTLLIGILAFNRTERTFIDVI